MVNKRRWFPVWLLVAGIAFADEAPPLTGESLKQRLQGNYTATMSAAERLKASRADTDSLRVLRKEDIHYRLPNGSYVLGMILPNGKVSPALRDGELLMPSCVTTDFAQIPGEWDGNAVRCDLRQDDLIVLDEHNTASQVGYVASDNSTRETVESTKSGEGDDIQLSHKYAARKDPAINVPPIEQEHPSSTDTQAHPIYDDARRSLPASSSSLYKPPARNRGKAKTVASVLRRDPNKFGVPIGSWVKAELLRPVSSAESGPIEFVLTEDLVGRYRTMPAGTTIFAAKAINESEKRLESLSQIAALPDGTEIKNISMRAFSLDKTAGIAGTLIRDREGEISAISTDVALSTISALTPGMEGPAGTAVEGMTSGVIGNEKKYVPNTPKAIIRVTPQQVLLKVARTF